MIHSLLFVGEVWLKDLPPEYQPPAEVVPWPNSTMVIALLVAATLFMIWIGRRRFDPDRPDALTRELFVAHKFNSQQRIAFMKLSREQGWEHAADGFFVNLLEADQR